jgi:hypothetical protein
MSANSDEVGAEVPPMEDVVVLPPVAKKVVSIPQDDGRGSGSDDGEDKAIHIPLRMTPFGIMWFNCTICLKEDYDSKAKAMHHVLEVIKQDAGMMDLVEQHL